MVQLPRRKAVTACLVAVLSAIAVAGVVARSSATQAGEDAHALRSAAVHAEIRTIALAAERHRVALARGEAARALARSAEDLGERQAAARDEAAALDRLVEERNRTEAEVAAVYAALVDASRQRERNATLLDALDRCLDGAVRASNALAVDRPRVAFDELSGVRGACDTVEAASAS